MIIFCFEKILLSVRLTMLVFIFIAMLRNCNMENYKRILFLNKVSSLNDEIKNKCNLF